MYSSTFVEQVSCYILYPEEMFWSRNMSSIKAKVLAFSIVFYAKFYKKDSI